MCILRSRPCSVCARARTSNTTPKTNRNWTRSLKKIRKKNVQVTRFKGLGEMNAEDLADTTMNPERRVILQVQLDDAMEAERIFSVLMGDKVEPRRRLSRNTPKRRPTSTGTAEPGSE